MTKAERRVLRGKRGTRRLLYVCPDVPEHVASMIMAVNGKHAKVLVRKRLRELGENPDRHLRIFEVRGRG